MANGTGKLIQHRFTVHPLFYYYYEERDVQIDYLKGIDTKTEFVAAQYSIAVLKDMIDKNIIFIDKEKGTSKIKNLDIDIVYQYIAEKRFMRKSYETRRNHLFSTATKKSSPHILLSPYYFPLYIGWLKTNAEILFSLSAYSSKAHQDEYKSLLEKWDTLLSNFENGDMSLIDDVEYNNTPDKIREIYLPTEELQQENNNLQEQLNRTNSELYNLKNTLSQYDALPELKKRIRDEINKEIKQQTLDLQKQLFQALRENESLTYSNKIMEEKLEMIAKDNIVIKQQYEFQIEEVKKQHTQEKARINRHIKKFEAEKESEITKFQHQVADIKKQLEEAQKEIQNVTYYRESVENALEIANTEVHDVKQQHEIQLVEMKELHKRENDQLNKYFLELGKEYEKNITDYNKLLNVYNKLVTIFTDKQRSVVINHRHYNIIPIIEEHDPLEDVYFEGDKSRKENVQGFNSR